MTTDVRQTFLETVDVALTLLVEPVLDTSWHEASQLHGYTCGGLAGHLVRSLLTVDTYLDDPVGSQPEALDAATYFHRALADHDPITSSMHVSVRERSAELAGSDAVHLRSRAAALRDRLHERLPARSAGESIRVLGGLVMTLDEYLDTRLVELVVHLDDLAVSLGLPTPSFPDDAARRVVAVLAELARRRRGDLALVRGLARTERSTGSIAAL